MNGFCSAGLEASCSGQGWYYSGHGWYCSGRGRCCSGRGQCCSGRGQCCSENSSSGLYGRLCLVPADRRFFSEHLPETSISLYFPVLFRLYWLNYTFYLFKLVIFLFLLASRLPVPVSLFPLPLLLLIPQLHRKGPWKKYFFLLLPTLWHAFCSLKRYPHRPETNPGFPPGTAPAASRQTDLCTP